MSNTSRGGVLLVIQVKDNGIRILGISARGFHWCYHEQGITEMRHSQALLSVGTIADR